MSSAKNLSETWRPLAICPACGRELYLIEVAGTVQCANCGWVCETCCEGGVPLEGEACPIPKEKPPTKTRDEKPSKRDGKKAKAKNNHHVS